jgi:hypothetical protein
MPVMDGPECVEEAFHWGTDHRSRPCGEARKPAESSFCDAPPRLNALIGQLEVGVGQQDCRGLSGTVEL